MLPLLSWRVRVYLFESCFFFNFLFARAPLTFVNIWKCFWRTSLKDWFDRPVQSTVFKCKRNTNTSTCDVIARNHPSFCRFGFICQFCLMLLNFFAAQTARTYQKRRGTKKGNRIYKIKTIRYLITSKWHVYYV